MGNTANQCRLGLFQDSDFAGDLEDSKSTSSGSSRTKFIRTSICWSRVGTTVRGSSAGAWMGMSFCPPKTRIVLIGKRG